jgi:hypothetical protein
MIVPLYNGTFATSLRHKPSREERFRRRPQEHRVGSLQAERSQTPTSASAIADALCGASAASPQLA